MPTTRFTTNLAAGQQVNNILDGSLFEIVRRPGRMSIAAVGDSGTTILMSVLADTETLLEESPVPLEPAAGQGPNVEDHLLLLESVAPGDKLTVRLRSTDAGATVVRTLISVP